MPDIELKELSRTSLNIMFQRLAQSDCGSNSCLFGGRGKGGMRTNGNCMCYQDLSHKIMDLVHSRTRPSVGNVQWPNRCIETGTINQRESGWEEGFNSCHDAFMKEIAKLPSCKHEVLDEKEVAITMYERNGRRWADLDTNTQKVYLVDAQAICSRFVRLSMDEHEIMSILNCANFVTEKLTNEELKEMTKAIVAHLNNTKEKV